MAVEVVNGAGPARGKEASVWGRRAGCVVGGGKRACCSGLSDTVRHSELPEHLSAASWTACWARVWLFVSVAVAAPTERVRSACPPAQRAVTQMAATKAAAQTGAPEAAMQAVAPEAVIWAVASVTGTRAAARGAATRVEAARRSRTLGVRELVTPQALAITPLLMNH